MSAPALVCSTDGTIVAINDQAGDWLMTSRTRAAGQSISEFLSTPRESLDEFLQRSQRRGHALYEGLLFRQTKHYRHAGMLCHAQVFHASQYSENLQLLVFTDDFTATEKQDTPMLHSAPRRADNLKLQQEMLEKLVVKNSTVNNSNAWVDVALGMVHEVNQPLTAIEVYACSCRRWLSEGVTEHPKLLPTIDKIIDQVHSTGHMINSLKKLVRGKDDIRSTFDLNQLVRESLELLALDPRMEHCKVESKLESGLCPVVVSSAQVKIVLLNLLRNALEASLAFDASEPCLSVSVTSKEKRWACATVIDTGAGIPSETEKHLFQPFVTSKSGGLGLGLVISRYLANAHAGFIEQQPCLPHGASFQLRLPLAR